jgi:hypothetical protein
MQRRSSGGNIDGKGRHWKKEVVLYLVGEKVGIKKIIKTTRGRKKVKTERKRKERNEQSEI